MILPVAMRRQARYKGAPTDGHARAVARSPRRILIVAVPPVRTLDLFGPVEVFGDANWLHGGDLAYEVNIISSGPERVVQSHLGTSLNTDQTYRECRGPIDTLLVAGYDSHQELRFEQDFLNWLREHGGRSRHFGSVVQALLCWLPLGCSMAGARPLSGNGATISPEPTR